MEGINFFKQDYLLRSAGRDSGLGEPITTKFSPGLVNNFDIGYMLNMSSKWHPTFKLLTVKTASIKVIFEAVLFVFVVMQRINIL